MKAVAFANSSTVFLCWIIKAAIADCLGFSIRRIEQGSGTKVTLPSWVPFAGQENSKWEARTTDVWPVQKFSWKDFTAAEGKTYQYEIVPMVGTPDKLEAKEELAVLTEPVTLATEYGDITLRFTKGILSTQALAKLLPKDAEGFPDYQVLLKKIATPGDPLREKLSRGIARMLMEPIRRAKADGGRVYQALYELEDPELVDCLLANKEFVSLILANTGADDETNAPARKRLHDAGLDISDRMLDSYGIGHNKSTVLVDKDGKPLSVTTGSTNWTSKGLCTQSNNVIAIRSAELAQQYLDYWKLLKAEGNNQSNAFRAANAKRRQDVVLPDGTRITVWFSPNTTEHVKPSKGATTPPDLVEVFDLMDKAKDQVLFLCFYPGFPSVISKIQELHASRTDLMIRGAVSSSQAMPKGDVELYHRQGAAPAIIAASAIWEEFGSFHKELLKAGPDAHAIIHDKIVVIDPLSPNCVVIVGSHNLGFKASYQNDENLLIIRGNRALAQAYMVHVLDVYDHYRFRYLRQKGKSTFSGFLSTKPDWQDKYLSGPARAELQRWTGETAAN